MDAMTQARQGQEKQGLCEIEVSYDGEADLHRHLQVCDKNPGHLNFIPVDQFNANHLPPGCHNNDLVDLVRALSDLTVRVSVNYTSEKRPTIIDGNGKPYPFYREKYRDMMRTGTGWVSAVDDFPEKDMDCNKICECRECLNSSSPKTQFAHIHIYTATHVVYDSLEGEHTTCHLFFDRGNTPELCSGVVTLSGMSHVWSRRDQDWCWMTYVTHDLDLANRLNKMVHHCKDLLLNACINYTNSLKSPLDPDQITANWRRLTIIVSHPHGCSKQVSIGHFTSRVEVKNFWTQYTYTTATCPGSSGAYVFVLARSWCDMRNTHVHSGNCQENKELNISGFADDNLMSEYFESAHASELYKDL